MVNNLDKLFKNFISGDVFSYSRLLTILEESQSSSPKLLNMIWKTLSKKSVQELPVVLGITGPPGAGKSSLVNLIADVLLKRDLKICILCIDPSSPFTGGALLGDRIRMNNLAGNKNVFIRSYGSRGQLGGLSLSIHNAIALSCLSNFDYILIETVGVGQTELEIMNVADIVCVVLVPESGDGVQVMKSGLMEVGNVFCVNKSDRPGSKDLFREISEFFTQFHIQKEIFLCSAEKNEGVEPLVNHFLTLAQNVNHRKTTLQKRRESALIKSLESEIVNKISRMKYYKNYNDLNKSPQFLAKKILKKITFQP